MDGRVKRPDLDSRAIAERWIAGESRLDLSITFNCSRNTIDSRLAKARIEFPDLPWNERQAALSGGSGVKNYLRMNDGKPGESVIPQGSIVNGRALRRR